MVLCDKINVHRAFWAGKGSSLILIPEKRLDLYDMVGYKERFSDPVGMLAHEMERARPVVDWPTDGIPTIRPNLGVVLIPAMVGQDFDIREGQMPWPGAPLSRDNLRTSRGGVVQATQMAELAADFYAAYHAQDDGEICAYLPDTQGVFDIAHILTGDDILHSVLLEPEWVDEVMEIALEWYIKATRFLKVLVGEPEGEMLHGHGTPQGVYFPTAGARVAEDTATLLSPQLIEQYVLPAIERVGSVFGGVFVHYCGRHEPLFEMLCQMPCVRAIDLGNPEVYEPRRLMELCAASGTVLCSRMAALGGEDWRAYTRRLGGLVSATGARCILRPLAFPQSRGECAAMHSLWHELTG